MATKISTEDWIEELKSISVLELSERIKALEEEFGVSATAVAAAAPAAAGAAAATARRRRGRVLDRRRRPDRGRRPESPRDQGRPRGHRTRPQRGQGARRRGPESRSKRASSARRPTNSKPNSRRPAPPSSSSRAARIAGRGSQSGSQACRRASPCVIFRGRAPFDVPLPISALYLRPSDRPRSRRLWHVRTLPP